MPEKVLITDSVHASLTQGLQQLGFAVDYQPDISLISCREIINEYAGVIINSKIKVDKSFLITAPKLKFIGRLGSGLEIIDIDAAEARGVTVINSPEGNSNAVGEHALGMLLALMNNLLSADREVRDFTWNREKNRGLELSGKVVGIYGFGHTGRSFARKLEGFDVDVVAYDKYKVDYEVGKVKAVSADDIFHCDVISFHLPLSPETVHLCDDEFLNQCHNRPIIINTSRGQVINTRDLVQSMENDQISGACLDVFENEKTGTYSEREKAIYQRLYAMKNTILTPHVAGWTVESKQRIASVLLQKISNLGLNS